MQTNPRVSATPGGNARGQLGDVGRHPRNARPQTSRRSWNSHGYLRTAGARCDSPSTMTPRSGARARDSSRAHRFGTAFWLVKIKFRLADQGLRPSRVTAWLTPQLTPAQGRRRCWYSPALRSTPKMTLSAPHISRLGFWVGTIVDGVLAEVDCDVNHAPPWTEQTRRLPRRLQNVLKTILRWSVC